MHSAPTETIAAERDRSLPGDITVLRYLGALTLLVFLLQTATGILLMIYYRPSVNGAYYSTGIIMDEVVAGWLIRSVHRWGSDLLILLSSLHLVRIYFSRAYQAPRQLNWVVGVCLLILVVTLGFTGTLLPWDQYAYWYIDSARATISEIPVLGTVVLGLIWGGWEIGEEVLLRFYAFHVGVLPWLAGSLLLLHVVLVWRGRIKPFAPDFPIHLSIVFLLVVGVVLTVAVLFPPALLEQADPVSPLSLTPPRWYLLPLRELLRALPGWVAALSVAVFLLLLFLVPVIDRGPVQPSAKAALQRALGVLVIAAWVLLGVAGFLR